MRIALGIDVLDARRGGAERGILALGKALQGSGHEIVLVSSRVRRLPEGWTWLKVRRPVLGRGRRVRGFAAAATRKLGGFGASVVFGDLPGGSVYLPHGGCWRAWRRQEIASAESPAEARRISRAIARSPRQLAARDLERATLSHGRLRGVIALSAMVERDLKAVGCPRPVSVIPNGIALPDRLPEQGKRGRPVLLFVAHNFRLKGLAPFLRILGRIGDAEGVVAGKDDPGPYRKLARGLKVKFLGSVPSMASLYALSDVLVQPTFYDPCSLTTLEALANGLPVVTSAFNGAGELIGEGAGAVVADPRDEEGFARAVAGLLGKDASAACRNAAEAVAEPGQTLKAVRQIEAWHA